MGKELYLRKIVETGHHSQISRDLLHIQKKTSRFGSGVAGKVELSNQSQIPRH